MNFIPSKESFLLISKTLQIILILTILEGCNQHGHQNTKSDYCEIYWKERHNVEFEFTQIQSKDTLQSKVGKNFKLHRSRIEKDEPFPPFQGPFFYSNGILYGVQSRLRLYCDEKFYEQYTKSYSIRNFKTWERENNVVFVCRLDSIQNLTNDDFYCVATVIAIDSCEYELSTKKTD